MWENYKHGSARGLITRRKYQVMKSTTQNMSLLALVMLLFGCQTKSVLMPGQEVISESNPAGETNPVVVPAKKPVEKK